MTQKIKIKIKPTLSTDNFIPCRKQVTTCAGCESRLWVSLKIISEYAVVSSQSFYSFPIGGRSRAGEENKYSCCCTYDCNSTHGYCSSGLDITLLFSQFCALWMLPFCPKCSCVNLIQSTI